MSTFAEARRVFHNVSTKIWHDFAGAPHLEAELHLRDQENSELQEAVDELGAMVYTLTRENARLNSMLAHPSVESMSWEEVWNEVDGIRSLPEHRLV